MNERTYNVNEIESMRQSLRWILIQPNVSYYPQDMEAKIEGQLRTYMAAGIDPAELANRANKIIAMQQNLSR